jgi:hypothetical protein
MDLLFRGYAPGVADGVDTLRLVCATDMTRDW